MTAVELRPLTRADRDLVASFFAGLSPRTLYRRFCSPKPRLTDRDLDVLSDVDGERHVALAAFTDTGETIAIGRFVRSQDDEQAGELGLTVTDAWQSRGVGSLLARVLAERALQQGLARFQATVLRDNAPAVAVLRKLGRPSVVAFDGPVLDFEVPLAPERYFAVAAWAPTRHAGAMPRFS